MHEIRQATGTRQSRTGTPRRDRTTIHFSGRKKDTINNIRCSIGKGKGGMKREEMASGRLDFIRKQRLSLPIVGLLDVVFKIRKRENN